MTVDGRWVTLPAVADWGNARTIINQPSAAMLGWSEFDYDHPVQGVFGPPESVPVSEDVYMRIGGGNPIRTNIMVANIQDNLLGFDVMQNYFKMTLDGNRVIMEEKDDPTAYDNSFIPEFDNPSETRALWGEQGWHEDPYAGSPDYVYDYSQPNGNPFV